MHKRVKYKRMVETRRLYKYEALFHSASKEISKERSEEYLRAMAKEVWAKHGRDGLSTPDIKIVDGATWSTCEGYSKIVLATRSNTRDKLPHNTLDVLLHELTHAMGYGTHGKGFVRKYVDLLVEYGKCDRGELLLGLGMFGIKA